MNRCCTIQFSFLHFEDAAATFFDTVGFVDVLESTIHLLAPDNLHDIIGTRGVAFGDSISFS
jgi:hypothetical protein